MRRAYWLLIVFGLWCLGCAVWYMFSIKGIPSDPRYFSPHPRLMAIGEILTMLLVTCIIGYFIGSSLRQGEIGTLWEAAEQLESEKKAFEQNARSLHQELAAAEEQRQISLRAAHEEMALAQRSSSALHQELADLQRTVVKLRDEQVARPSDPELEAEAITLRFRVKQLEFKNQESEDAIARLNQELIAAMGEARHTSESVHPFVRPVTEEEKDDLTVIKGIGPFIEKRLNMVGIYTLKQISEFTPESIEQVTKAIEFFPNRMVRDNWVGQARQLVGRR